MKRARVGDVIAVEWIDSEQIRLGWDGVAAYRKAAGQATFYESAGHFLGEVTQPGGGPRVLVAISIDAANGNVTSVMAIPKAAVRKLTVLGRASKRVRKALS